MEFKYRAIDETRSNFTPQSSNYSYFTEQAFRAGYTGGPSHAGPGFRRPNEYYRNPIEMRETVWRELEKEKIREELIAEEIARRRMLEAEVRRELMIERELAMRRGGDGFFFSSTPNTVRLEPVRLPALPLPNRSEGRSHEGRIAVSDEERLGMSVMLRREFGGFDSTPFQPQRSSEPRISEVKPAPEVSKENEKIVFLAKPEANLSGAKRKAETSPLVDASELLSAGAPKKRVNEWSCALCQVSATSERGLNEHLQGKKHKAKEAGLSKNGKNFSIGLFPKKTAKPNKVTDIANSPSSEQGLNTVAEFRKLGWISLQKDTNSQSAKENNGPLLTKNQHSGDSVKKNKATVKRKQKTSEKKMKRFRFWCEMCKVGAFCEKVMEAHRTGKKHISRLQEVDQNSGVEPSTQNLQATQELNLVGEAGKDGENTVSEYADGVIDGIELEAHQKVEAYADAGVDH